ncbi:MAG: hypothetical protein HEEMFOPI_01605 [Holosporales bacterium]
MNKYQKIIGFLFLLFNIGFATDSHTDPTIHVGETIETLEPEVVEREIRENFFKVDSNLERLRGKNIVAFFGYSGAGKSTLINMLTGIPLKKDLNTFVLDRERIELMGIDNRKIFEIGLSGDSVTCYPEVVEVDNLFYVDIPGICDTKGTIRDILTASFIKEIFENAASIRLVIVASEGEYSTMRGSNVKDLLSSLPKLFGESDFDKVARNSFHILTQSTGSDTNAAFELAVRSLRQSTSERYPPLPQIQTAKENGNFHAIFRPETEYGYGERNEQSLQYIKRRLTETRPFTVRKLNSEERESDVTLKVDALYPISRSGKISEMFKVSMENMLLELKTKEIEILSQYESEKSFISDNDELFWNRFEQMVLERKGTNLLKGLCTTQYNQAWDAFRNTHKEERSIIIASLDQKKEEITKQLQIKTKTRFQEAVAQIIPEGLVFDLAYYKDIEIAVCGAENIDKISKCVVDQKEIKREFVKLLNDHSYKKMNHYLQDFFEKNKMLAELKNIQERMLNVLRENGLSI